MSALRNLVDKIKPTFTKGERGLDLIYKIA